jgi:hypothetical protein
MSRPRRSGAGSSRRRIEPADHGPDRRRSGTRVDAAASLGPGYAVASARGEPPRSRMASATSASATTQRACGGRDQGVHDERLLRRADRGPAKPDS